MTRRLVRGSIERKIIDLGITSLIVNILMDSMHLQMKSVCFVKRLGGSC